MPGPENVSLNEGRSKKRRALAVGCVAVLLFASVAMVCAFGALVFFFAPSGEVPEGTADAIAIANRDPRVAETFGTPLEATGRKSGGVTTFMDDEMLDTVVNVKGPRGKGAFHIAGQRKRGRLWSYDTLVLSPQVGQPIDLRKRPR